MNDLLVRLDAVLDPKHGFSMPCRSIPRLWLTSLRSYAVR